MHRRPMALTFLGLPVIALTLTACLQWGEYAMGSECEAFAEDIDQLVSEAYGEDVRIDRVWAGESEVWCSFDVLTGMNLPKGDRERTAVFTEVQEALAEAFDTGVEVTLVYAEDADFAVLDTRRSIDRASCAELAERVLPLAIDRFGAGTHLSSVSDRMDSAPALGCSIRIVTEWDPIADEALREQTLAAIRAVLPDNSEVHLIHLGANDVVWQPARFSFGEGEPSPKCVETSKAAEIMLRAHFASADALQSETGTSPAGSCRFYIILEQDIAFDDPSRTAAREMVRSAIPADVEAHLLYPDGRDTIVTDTRGN